MRSQYAISCGFDRKAYLDDLDREGIDVGVLFSTAGLGFCWYDDLDPEFSAALCRAYNNWLYDPLPYRRRTQVLAGQEGRENPWLCKHSNAITAQ